MKYPLLALAPALVCLHSAAAGDPAPTVTTIQHVTVVNVITGTETPEQTVRVQGDRILSVAPTDPADAAVPAAIDAHGDFLIPGLWDMHVHVHDTNELPLYIANGVTGIRIMAGAKDTGALRADLAKQPIAPDIDLASAIVDGPSPMWPGSFVIKTPADARRTVDGIKAGGADFIKVYDSIPRDA